MYFTFFFNVYFLPEYFHINVFHFLSNINQTLPLYVRLIDQGIPKLSVRNSKYCLRISMCKFIKQKVKQKYEILIKKLFIYGFRTYKTFSIVKLHTRL